jgi:hypothetical protein
VIVTWPFCALVLGALTIVALWDGLRRHAEAKGLEARVEQQIKTHAIEVERMRVNAERAIGELASELGALKNGLAMRSVRSA